MPSKQQDAVKSKISPVLFMTTDGEPMSFFLRPGPVKRKLQPLITAGGGLLCNVQQPGAILLINPEERDSIPETTAHWYVSSQYIHDCVEKEEQLNLEDYRLNPEVAPRPLSRLNKSKDGSPGLGRVAYTPEDDAAILRYVSKHKTEIGGNRLWQEMEKQDVTSHSWQSMKYRYRVQLAKKQSEGEEANMKEEDGKVADKETKDEENQEKDIQKLFHEEDAVPPPHLPEVDPLQTLSAETDLTQVYAPPISDGEVQHVNPQTDPQTAESTKVATVAAGTSDSLQPEGLCLDPEADVRPISAESTEPESVISPQNEYMPENSPQSLPDTPSQIQRKVKQKASPKLEQPQRRISRRQLELEAPSSPEPYGKKLRSSSTSAEKLLSPPLTLKKTKSSVKSALQKSTTIDQQPSKKARGESVAAVTESQQGESEEAAVPEALQTDEESNSLMRKGEKKKEKRKLGILELATKEFEDESESGEDEGPDLQNPAETATIQPTSTDPRRPPPDANADPSKQSNSEPGPNLQANGQEAQDSTSSHVPEASCSKPAAAEAVHVASRAHLFIFDSESQEDDSQSLGNNTAAAAQPVVSTNAALSLTQAQLEEDKQRIRDLMAQTNQDLASVTKALLKTSGDLSAALNLLLNPSSFSGPFWNRYDDGLLLSADPVARQQLQEKYGEEDLAKRVVFLEMEG